MAKTAKTTEKPGHVFHAKHLTAKEKAAGVTYTYDWNKVTAPEHLALRNKALLEAQETRNDALEAEAAENAPAPGSEPATA